MKFWKTIKECTVLYTTTVKLYPVMMLMSYNSRPSKASRPEEAHTLKWLTKG